VSFEAITITFSFYHIHLRKPVITVNDGYVHVLNKDVFVFVAISWRSQETWYL